MHSLRRYKLARLIETRFRGDRGAFVKEAGITKGRLSQLLDPDSPFGDVAARNMEDRLRLEALPEHVKAQWEQLAGMLGGKPKP